MPTYQMNWRPTKVTGINKTSLAWLAGKMGYAEEWQHAARGWQFGTREAKADRYVTTTKDPEWARSQHIAGRRAFTVGYQHIPFVTEVRIGEYGPIEPLGPFGPGHPFCKLHKVSEALQGFYTPCGFPHLDKKPVDLEAPRPTVLLQHHGGYRGIAGHRWMIEICLSIVEAGYDAAISAHWIPGLGYDDISLHYAMKGGFPYSTGYWFTPHWRSVAAKCKLTLTTGSSAAYEMWSVGLKNVYILTYLGGSRDRAFRMFPDICINSEDELKLLLSGRLGKGNYPMTQEVMEAFDSIHTGQGAKIAADVIEGER